MEQCRGKRQELQSGVGSSEPLASRGSKGVANDGNRNERLLDDELGVKPEHAIAKPPKRASLTSIRPAAQLVDGPIDFDDELGGSGDEVSDVASERHLALELNAKLAA